jgi:hypothetical protein
MAKKLKRFEKTESIKTLFLVLLGLIFAFIAILILQILGYVLRSDVLSFAIGLLAGIFGILIGFSLDRFSDEQKDIQTKNDFLNLIQEELRDIKSKIYPQTRSVYLLYTDIWDSMISSGVIKLLTSQQVTELSSVYKFIKGTSYEAEWVRQDFEELESIPQNKKDEIECVNKKCVGLMEGHIKRMNELNKQIDEVLKKEWWNKTS